MAAPAPRRAPTRHPPDAAERSPSFERALRLERAKRRARIEHRLERRRARRRFAFLLFFLIILAILLGLTIWDQIQALFGL